MNKTWEGLMKMILYILLALGLTVFTGCGDDTATTSSSFTLQGGDS